MENFQVESNAFERHLHKPNQNLLLHREENDHRAFEKTKKKMNTFDSKNKNTIVFLLKKNKVYKYYHQCNWANNVSSRSCSRMIFEIEPIKLNMNVTCVLELNANLSSQTKLTHLSNLKIKQFVFNKSFKNKKIRNFTRGVFGDLWATIRLTSESDVGCNGRNDVSRRPGVAFTASPYYAARNWTKKRAKKKKN